jgi:hypothetical protein
MMATDAFTAYTKATGGVMDSATGLLTITEAQYNALESLVFTIGGTPFELTANAQIWPRALNSTLGGDANKIYLVAADLGSNSGSGLDFIVRTPSLGAAGDRADRRAERIRDASAVLLDLRHDQFASRLRHYAVHGRDDELRKEYRLCVRVRVEEQPTIERFLDIERTRVRLLLNIQILVDHRTTMVGLYGRKCVEEHGDMRRELAPTSTQRRHC